MALVVELKDTRSQDWRHRVHFDDNEVHWTTTDFGSLEVRDPDGAVRAEFSPGQWSGVWDPEFVNGY
jgi:hypothetical protein